MERRTRERSLSSVPNSGHISVSVPIRSVISHQGARRSSFPAQPSLRPDMQIISIKAGVGTVHLGAIHDASHSSKLSIWSVMAIGAREQPPAAGRKP